MINKKKLPIKIIVLTVILDSVGIGIMIPVLPSLMTDVLPGKTVAEAAVWGGILASIFAVMQFIFGPIHLYLLCVLLVNHLHLLLNR